MSAQGKQNSEVEHGRRPGNRTLAGADAVSISINGIRLAGISAAAFNVPDLRVARFLIAQGQLIEELACLKGGAR